MDSLGYRDESVARESEYIEADAGARLGWARLLACLLFLLAIAAVAIGIFLRYAHSFRFAIALIAFLLTYVVVIGYLASKTDWGRR